MNLDHVAFYDGDPPRPRACGGPSTPAAVPSLWGPRWMPPGEPQPTQYDDPGALPVGPALKALAKYGITMLPFGHPDVRPNLPWSRHRADEHGAQQVLAIGALYRSVSAQLKARATMPRDDLDNPEYIPPSR